MTPPRLNLIVLRAAEPERLAGFYAALGLSFETHRHGKDGPEHQAAEVGGLVFEIYPLAGGTPTAGTRVGFTVSESVDAAVARLVEAGGSVVSLPKPSPWGRRAVLTDPEGHRVELTESSLEGAG